MSHYSDIGFKVKEKEDVLKVFNSIHANERIPKNVWETGKRGRNYVIHYIDDIRYISLVHYGRGEIEKLSLGHDNENLSKVKIVERLHDKTDTPDFDTLQVEKDDIPFWFSCANVDNFAFKEGEELDIKIASFANSVEVKDAGSEDKTKEFQMADESYIADFNGDPSCAFVSGIIQDVKIKKNPLTKKHYYAVDVSCLGLNFKMLVDEKKIKKNQLRPGRVLCGQFWNTALLVDEEHPDYF